MCKISQNCLAPNTDGRRGPESSEKEKEWQGGEWGVLSGALGVCGAPPKAQTQGEGKACHSRSVSATN